MDVRVSSIAERPDRLPVVFEMADTWPEFVTNDPVGTAHYGRIPTELPQYALFAEDEHGEIVAHAFSVPFALDVDGRRTLPARGWDQVLLWAFADLRRGTRPDTVSAISVTIAPHAQGHGLSAVMLSAMRDRARALGFREVVAPVAPAPSTANRTPRSVRTPTGSAPTACPRTRGCASTRAPAHASTPSHRPP